MLPPNSYLIPSSSTIQPQHAWVQLKVGYSRALSVLLSLSGKQISNHANWTTSLKECLEMLYFPNYLCLKWSFYTELSLLKPLMPLSHSHFWGWSCFLTPWQNLNNQKRTSTSSHPALPPVSMDEFFVLLPKAQTFTCILDPIPLCLLQYVTTAIISLLLSPLKKRNSPHVCMSPSRCLLWQNFTEGLNLLAAFTSSLPLPFGIDRKVLWG